MTQFAVRKNVFGRWIIVAALNPFRAWSGSRWVDITRGGLPEGVQICDFATAAEAAELGEHVQHQQRGK